MQLYKLHLAYPFSHGCTFGLPSCLGYYGQHCYKYQCLNVFLLFCLQFFWMNTQQQNGWTAFQNDDNLLLLSSFGMSAVHQGSNPAFINTFCFRFSHSCHLKRCELISSLVWVCISLVVSGVKHLLPCLPFVRVVLTIFVNVACYTDGVSDVQPSSCSKNESHSPRMHQHLIMLLNFCPAFHQIFLPLFIRNIGVRFS